MKTFVMLDEVAFGILFQPFKEALEILGLEYVVNPDFTVRVNRNSVVRSFPSIKESHAYDAAYYEVLSYTGCPFYWAKLDDDWFIMEVPEYEDDGDDGN